MTDRQETPLLASSRASALARCCVAAVALYVAVDVLLAFLRPHDSLLYNAESDYGRGPFFWVMDLNFLLRCALTLALVGALRLAFGAIALKRGLFLLTLWALCSGLLALFADDPEGQPLHGSGRIHVVLAFVAFVAVAIGTVLLSTALRSEPRYQSLSGVLLTLSSLGVVSLLVLGKTLGRHHAPGGLVERIFLGIELAWIVLAASPLALPAAGRRGPVGAGAVERGEGQPVSP
ncbi:MAG TPA: DUF998 domain-containing protein [Acidimicrobiales bacterium]|nr:DUF998 domain-containing protein [Acidimicrobiales bacterium]